MLPLRPLYITEPLLTIKKEQQLKHKDRELLNQIVNHPRYQPNVAIERFSEIFNPVIKSDLSKSKLQYNYRTKIFNLGHNLKTYYIAKGALENNIETIKSACEINGRLKLLGYYMLDDLRGNDMYFHHLFYSILANDKESVDLYSKTFMNYNSKEFLTRAIHEICSRNHINSTRNLDILSSYKEKQSSKWGVAVNSLIKSVLINDEDEYHKQAIDILKLHRRTAVANGWHEEISVPIKSLAYIWTGSFNSTLRIPDLSQFDKFAIPKLNEFMKAMPNKIGINAIMVNNTKVYDAINDIKSRTKPEELFTDVKESHKELENKVQISKGRGILSSLNKLIFKLKDNKR